MRRQLFFWLRCRFAATNSNWIHRLEWPSAREKIVARGSLFVARKNLPLYSNGLWWNLSGGLPLYCGPFHQPSCHSLQSWPDGLKRHGKPLQFGHGPCFFVACRPRSFFIAWLQYRRGRPNGRPAWILCISGIYDGRRMVVIQSWVCRGGTPHLSPRKGRSSLFVARKSLLLFSDKL